MYGRSLNLRPDPFAEVGAGVGIFAGALLGVVDDQALVLAGMDLFGTVPEVEAVGNDGNVLGADEDDGDEG